MAVIAAIAFLASGGGSLAESPATRFKAELTEAFERGRDVRVRRNVITALRRAAVRDPDKIHLFAKLSMKATKSLNRGAEQRVMEDFTTRFMAAAMKAYYQRRSDFDRKLQKSLTSVLRTAPPHSTTDDFIDRLYLRQLPIQIAANQDPEELKWLLDDATRIIEDF